MALPRTAPTSWIQGLDFPSQLFETGGNEYELYEEDEGFAEYTNGILEVRLPIEGVGASGEEIEIEAPGS